MTALLEYIDLFLLNVQKCQIILCFKFLSKCQHYSEILILIIIYHYAHNYSGIIPAPLIFHNYCLFMQKFADVH